MARRVVLAVGLSTAATYAQVEERTAGFVVHQWGNAKARGQASCPDGRSLGYRQIFERGPQGARREGETEADYVKRMRAGGVALAHVDGKNLCVHPELAPDPHFRTMDDPAVASYGIDLDGVDSSRHNERSLSACAHDDFPGVDGAGGIDNQYFRLTGCSGNPSVVEEAHAGWLPPYSEALENTMLEGGWGVLIELRGVDDYQNDDSIEVGIYANADPIVLSAQREPIPYATYAAELDPRFRGETHGKIVDGVLTTQPTHVRFHWLVAGLHLERPLNNAQIKARFSPDGVLEGYLGGYTPVEALYDFQYGFRSATDKAGNPAPANMLAQLATGAASAMNRTCNGAYAASWRLADGDPDPDTGRCTSVSTQYFFRATPAFVVNVETRGLNDELVNEDG